MENSRRKRRLLGSGSSSSSTHHRNNHLGVWEENTMAILDSSGFRDSSDLHDDQLCFLEAVRSASLGSESPSAPSCRIFDSVFRILVDCNTLELAMGSFQLLTDLNKRYPRVYLTTSEEPEDTISKLVVLEEAWSPFSLASYGAEGTTRGSCVLFVSLGDETKLFCCEKSAGSLQSFNLKDFLKSFSSLIEDMAETLNKLDFDLKIKPVQNLLLFQYLINVLEEDLLPRLSIYKENRNWVFIRESLLNNLLGSRKINFKSLVRDCLSILLKRCHHSMPNNFQQLRNSEDTCPQSNHDSKNALAIALSKLEKETCVAVQKFFKLVMELDIVRKESDTLGLTSRLDGCRLPILDIIVDELTYNKDTLAPFLVVFSEPNWKLEVILQYFSKYLKKPSVRTRSSHDTSNDATLVDVLSNFSTAASTKNITKKIPSETAQLLLAHAFQASLSLVYGPKKMVNSAEKLGASFSVICNNVISASRNLRKIDEDLEISSFAKEALFTAATILKTQS